MERKKSYYLATLIIEGKPTNVGFSLEWPSEGKISPQARVLAAAHYSAKEKLEKSGKYSKGEIESILPEAERLNIQNISIVYEHGL